MVTAMGTPTRGATRIARAAAFGVATLTLATGAHILAGGALPSLMVLASLTLPLTTAAVLLTSRRCGPLLLLGSLATAQVLLHETLMTLAAHAPGDLTPAGLGGHHGAHVSTPGADGWSVAMTAAHVVATVVTALVLARGEQALWQLVSRLLPTLPRIPRVLSCGPRQAPALLSLPVFRPSLVSGGSGLRGPPAGFVATA